MLRHYHETLLDKYSDVWWAIFLKVRIQAERGLFSHVLMKTDQGPSFTNELKHALDSLGSANAARQVSRGAEALCLFSSWWN